jgi:hypothetical protein
MDGSLTNTKFNTRNVTSGTLTYGWPHLLQNAACQSASNKTKWDNAAVCNEAVTIRQVMFGNLVEKEEFKSISIKARQINSTAEWTAQN